MSEEEQAMLLRLAAVIMKNEKAEAKAVKGYTKQLDVIREAKEVFAQNAELAEYLDKLEAATEEKISDELNHGHSLYLEYEQITDIAPAED